MSYTFGDGIAFMRSAARDLAVSATLANPKLPCEARRFNDGNVNAYSPFGKVTNVRIDTSDRGPIPYTLGRIR